ncbi:MAG: TrkA family potassium uptake protein [Fimbriimonadaceae bacterium]|nr:TrkA family potassium uptake protein [Fimbriimonadaceae bacterium]
MYIILMGGGNVGTQLAKRFIAQKHEVLLLEKDSTHARKLAALLGEQHVVHGDGCDIRIQKAAGFNRAEVVVAVTGEDEDNLIACQLAKSIWKVKRVVARVNDPSHEQVFRDLGIDDCVSATSIIFNLLDQQVSSDLVIPVGALHKGGMEVVESTLSGLSPLLGVKVRDLALPPGTFLVYLLRGTAGGPIDGETVLQEGDMVVALVPLGEAENLRQVLATAPR